MFTRTRTTCLLIAALGIALSPLAAAWTPYGYGPHAPGYPGGYPGMAPPEFPPGTANPGPPPSTDSPTGHDSARSYSDDAGAMGLPYGEFPPGAAPPAPGYPDYGPPSRPPWGFPGAGRRSFGPRPGFRLSRSASEDAYRLTIELKGMGPEEVQVRTQGQSLVISREHTEQQVQKDSSEDGRGFRRSFSYSSGTARQRLPVPSDGDLSAMSREDSEGSIQIHIPRRGH